MLAVKDWNAEDFAEELFHYIWEYFKVDSNVRPQRTKENVSFIKKPKVQEPMQSTSFAKSEPQDSASSTSFAKSEPSTSSGKRGARRKVASTDPPESKEKDPLEVFQRIVRAVIGMQICFRSDLKAVFDRMEFLDIRGYRFMKLVSDYLNTFEVDKNIFERTLGSCVIYAEFALYKQQMKNENYLALVPSLWCMYFEKHLQNAGFKAGGWDALEQETIVMRETVSVLDETLFNDFSSPYETVEYLEDIKRLIPGLRQKLDRFIAKFCSA